MTENASTAVRARDLGIPFDGTPGALNAITDIDGVLVGQQTIIRGDGQLTVGEGPVRTGVTMILPCGFRYDPIFAAWYALNGNGEMTGTTWIEESGFLEGGIGLTNTHSVGVVRDAMIRWQYSQNVSGSPVSMGFWGLPVVAETWDGLLNDINGHHVLPEHVFAAFADAKSGAVAEGAVGGGTGMICHGFKGGIGTSSRVVTIEDQQYTVGALVQANYGRRARLTIAGVPVGRDLMDIPIPGKPSSPPMGVPLPPPGSGSIIVVVATDAPLLPHQLKRIARRVPLGIGLVGGVGDNTSGDIFIAFSTANAGAAVRSGIVKLDMLPNDVISPLFDATVHATEEAIINAMVAAPTMTGIDGNTAHKLPHDRVREILQRYGRL